jgi:predicted ester cyclase
MCRTGDVEQAAQLVTEDYFAHGPGGSSGRAEFENWPRWYSNAFAEQRPVLEDIVDGGDRVVVRYTIRSTYRGGFLDLPGHDQPVRETGIIMFRFVGGKVAESWYEGNDLEIAQQLGARITAPGPDPGCRK